MTRRTVQWIEATTQKGIVSPSTIHQSLRVSGVAFIVFEVQETIKIHCHLRHWSVNLVSKPQLRLYDTTRT
jgi:hypothetical protein